MFYDKSHAPSAANCSSAQAVVTSSLHIPLLSNRRALHVLVAEDDVISRQVLEKYLKALGHTVVLTTNGEECVTQFASESHAFDIILTDIRMPIMDGFAVTELIRAVETETMGAVKNDAGTVPHIPILAVSSSVVETEKDKYIEAGLDGWIMKPIDSTRLELLLRGVSDQNVREMCTYKPGQWDIGGWFEHIADRHAWQ